MHFDGGNRQLVTDEPVEFEKKPVAGKLPIVLEESIEHTHPNLIKGNRRMSNVTDWICKHREREIPLYLVETREYTRCFYGGIILDFSLPC